MNDMGEFPTRRVTAIEVGRKHNTYMNDMESFSVKEKLPSLKDFQGTLIGEEAAALNRHNKRINKRIMHMSWLVCSSLRHEQRRRLLTALQTLLQDNIPSDPTLEVARSLNRVNFGARIGKFLRQNAEHLSCIYPEGPFDYFCIYYFCIGATSSDRGQETCAQPWKLGFKGVTRKLLPNGHFETCPSLWEWTDKMLEAVS